MSAGWQFHRVVLKSQAICIGNSPSQVNGTGYPDHGSMSNRHRGSESPAMIEGWGGGVGTDSLGLKSCSPLGGSVRIGGDSGSARRGEGWGVLKGAARTYEICAEGIPQAGRIPGGAVSPRIQSGGAVSRRPQGTGKAVGSVQEMHLHGCSSCPYPIRIRRLSGICPGCGPVGVHDSRSLASLSAATPACIEFLGSTLFPGSQPSDFQEAVGRQH